MAGKKHIKTLTVIMVASSSFQPCSHTMPVHRVGRTPNRDSIMYSVRRSPNSNLRKISLVGAAEFFVGRYSVHACIAAATRAAQVPCVAVLWFCAPSRAASFVGRPLLRVPTHHKFYSTRVHPPNRWGALPLPSQLEPPTHPKAYPFILT